MASVVWHFFNQYRATGKVQLFEGSGGYAAGEQRRDFVSVDDVVAVNLDFLDHPERSGIFNLGTGKRRDASTRWPTATINACRQADGAAALSFDALHRAGAIEYIAFPAGTRRQSTRASRRPTSARLRDAGYTAPFLRRRRGRARAACSALLAQSQVNA